MNKPRLVLSIIFSGFMFSSFQNCSKMNFSGEDTKQLVSGTASDTAPTDTTSSTPTKSATPPPDIGICALTCGGYTNQEHELNQSAASCKTPPQLPLCASEHNNSKSVIQTLTGTDVHPKTVCVSHTACAMLGSQLASGTLILMKTDNKASTMNATNFEPVNDPSDCEDILSDSEVSQMFDLSS